jgi:hypothetical protein
MKAVRSEEVGKILERKLRIPYFALRGFNPGEDVRGLLPLDYMKLNRVIPLQKMEHRIKIGLCDPLDRTVIDAVKSMTQLRPIPYLVMEEEFEEFFHREVPSGLSEAQSA